MKKETIERILRFSRDRDWNQFHTPANLAKSISIEANELLECFQWDEENYVERLGLDIDEIVNRKMDLNEKKYPVEKAKGRADKYDKL